MLALLTVFGPISMDLYLPVLPALTTELQSAASMAQLTITACLLGLALGQLIAGPLSDRYGRRRPLLVGVGAYIVFSATCALSPTIETLIAARFVQGLAGAVGIVIAQAAGRDLYSGGRLVRYYGRLTVLAGLAAIVGPVIGGQLAKVTDWRGIFVFLAAVGVIVLLASLMVMRETLPVVERTSGALTAPNENRATPSSDDAVPATCGYSASASDVVDGVVAATPLTRRNNEPQSTISGRCHSVVTMSADAPAPHIVSPTARVPVSDQRSARRPARKPNTMNPNEFSPKAIE